MSFKGRIIGPKNEVIMCRIKDLYGPGFKMRSLTYQSYMQLKKEMEIDPVAIVHKGDAAEYRRVLGITDLPSVKRTLPFYGDDGTVDASTLIPSPPKQFKERLPGETDKQFRTRRMFEGKAYKKWETEHGEAYARARSAESSETGNLTGDVTPSETAPVGVAEAGAPGDEAADSGGLGHNAEPTEGQRDFIKEEIERMSMEQLERDHGG